MRVARRPLVALGLTLGLAAPTLTGCFEQEEPTCAYWVPKLTSAQRGDKALQMVEELKCAEAVPTLTQMFDDGLYRERVLRTVKQIGDKGAGAPLLKKALVARDTSKLAASIVKDWGLAEARPELETILTGPGLPKNRPEALEALLSFEKPENVLDLLVTLAGEDPNFQGMRVNKVAVQTLGELGDPKAADVMIQAAFLKTNTGESIYLVVREALSKLGLAGVDKLVAIADGKDEAMKAFADDRGLSAWEWRLGPELSQMLSDTLDPRAAGGLARLMKLELVPPPGVSEASTEKWRTAQLNRLKLAMLGIGHIGADDAVVETLKAIIKDPVADAINQRLNSATALALIGSKPSLDTLLEVYKTESDSRFRAPLLQPLTLGLGFDHLAAYDEMIKTDDSKIVAEKLGEERIKTYLAVVRECKNDGACYVQKLKSSNKDEQVKAAVVLMRGLGDKGAAQDGLFQAFSSSDPKNTDLRRFTMMAMTRLGDRKVADKLDLLAQKVDGQGVWPLELRTAANYLRARK